MQAHRVRLRIRGDVTLYPRPFSRGTNFRLVSSIGMVVSLTPWEIKIFGLPRAATGLRTPGDIAMHLPEYVAGADAERERL